VSEPDSVEQLEAEVRYYNERLALLRAKTYRGGATSTTRLRELERLLNSAEKRLRGAHAHQAH
jgi:ribosomal protein L29